MNTRMLLASLAAAVFLFLWGWVLWDMLGLMDYFAAHSTDGWNALYKMEANMNWLGLVLANVFSGLLIGWIVWKTNSHMFVQGFITGAIVGGLFTASLDMMFYALMNVYTDKMIVIVDVLIQAASMGLAGGVAGLVMGMGGKKDQ